MTTLAAGEDRSSYQKVYRWLGLDFGFAKATEGTAIIDSTFDANWQNLKAEGKPRGAYHFLHPGQDIQKQAALFLKVVKEAGLVAGDMLVVDSEILAGFHDGHPRATLSATVEDLGLTAEQVDQATLDFLDLVAAGIPAGVIVMTYSNINVASMLHKTAAKYPLLWLAHPSSIAPTEAECGPFKAWVFWQWGIVANVDRDSYKGTAADLDAWIKSHLPKPKPPMVLVHWRVLGPTTLAGAAHRHHTTPEAMIRAAARAGHVYGRWMTRYINRGDWNALLPIGTTLYAEEIA